MPGQLRQKSTIRISRQFWWKILPKKSLEHAFPQKNHFLCEDNDRFALKKCSAFRSQGVFSLSATVKPLFQWAVNKISIVYVVYISEMLRLLSRSYLKILGRIFWTICLPYLALWNIWHIFSPRITVENLSHVAPSNKLVPLKKFGTEDTSGITL